jgi:hypothetical protein
MRKLFTWGNVLWACALAASCAYGYKEMEHERARADTLWDLAVSSSNKISLLELRVKSLEQDRASR